MSAAAEDRAKAMARFEEACADAKERQESNRKLRETYVKDKAKGKRIRESLIADLRRVFEHPDNPFKGFAASRARYRQLGHYPEVFVVDFFGTHEEFQRAAGLRDDRNTSRTKLKIARLNTAMQVAEYARKHVTRWTGLYEKAAGRKHLEVLIGSDFHSYFVDPFALDVLIDTAKMVQPDIVVLNGDVFDFPQISRHRQLPGHFTLNLQAEIDFGREKIIRRVREACPGAQIDLVIGNHEFRLVNYLADTAPALASLRTIEFNRLLEIEDLEINLVCRSSFLSPTKADRKRDQQENWNVIGGCFITTHGTSIAKFAAEAQMRRFQMSGTSGHTHRPQIITDNALGTGPLSWMSTPMMASHAVGRDYVPEPSQWNMGFGLVSILPEKRAVSQQLVVVHPEWASFAGRVWAPTKKALQRREEQWSVMRAA